MAKKVTAKATTKPAEKKASSVEKAPAKKPVINEELSEQVNTPSEKPKQDAASLVPYFRNLARVRNFGLFKEQSKVHEEDLYVNTYLDTLGRTQFEYKYTDESGKLIHKLETLQ